MKKELLLLLLLILLPSVYGTAVYQEDANSTSDDGSWNTTALFDGNWGTSSSCGSGSYCEAYANYSLITGTNSTLWQVKGSITTLRNLTVPDSCNASTVRFKIGVTRGSSWSDNKWYCWDNTSTWLLIRRDFNSGGDQPVYEEGLFFMNITEPSIPNYLYVNGSMNNLSFSYGADLNLTGWMNGSGDINIWINSSYYSNPQESFVLPAGYWEVKSVFNGSSSFFASNSSSLFMNVSKAIPVFNLSVVPDSINEEQSSVIVCSGIPDGSLYFNGVLQASPYTVSVLAVGSYAVVCNYSGDVNYTSGSTSGTLVVGELCVSAFSPEFVELGVLLVLLFGFLIAIGRPFMSKDDFTGYALKLVLLFLALVFVLYYVANWSSIC